RGRIDPYAVESPAEFFAVVTEFFFEVSYVFISVLVALRQLIRRVLSFRSVKTTTSKRAFADIPIAI
ncbi:MAG: zinc-dependent peptidase, partial [Anaerolineales bacterium]